VHRLGLDVKLSGDAPPLELLFLRLLFGYSAGLLSRKNPRHFGFPLVYLKAVVARFELRMRNEADDPAAVVHIRDTWRKLPKRRCQCQREQNRGAGGILHAEVDGLPAGHLSVYPGLDSSVRQPVVYPPDDSRMCFVVQQHLDDARA
jgi:hypothetical protein